ncbi:hypothetical protein [Nocardia sp. CDC160]|uniref:hypothetical protein n=1 Tax=Nocardia sp. CDC160 TaxID=3112166 RepID=UPI002DC001FE|nr:hypothetical protein [Nocardia sp. CDC160]MEC3916486.1 hypothetical protein [Nocardia sp. CDC160]
MRLVRELRYAPLWVVVVVAGLFVSAYSWGYMALTGIDRFSVAFWAVLCVISMAAVGFGQASIRKRFGGRDQMRRFDTAVRTSQLPTLTSPDEIVQWNQWIVHERNRRQGDRNVAWIWLAASAVVIVLGIAIPALKGIYSGDLGMALIILTYLGNFAWTRISTPRVLAALAALSTQGTTRGYGHSLPTN